ncbi:p74 [Matsumuraeses phaseoli granulovirus]|uniref:P74 n=1 Tax=Matsumuraeses phaseoli granulovirus TaxID=2760664 RepID=A0AAE7SY98_9BBAC|nr:p74 [Matsumuraeses phaseoli granulovirus]QOD40016.1 p74 [Matsumuraeses phaseoli granulovirus]
MATPTQLDLIYAVQYLTNRDALSFIPKWRARFPHILIDYTLRYAVYDDYHVPRPMLQNSAMVVEVFFSKQGCESMSCFPYTETGVIDYMKSPLGGYTQTSDTPVQYNQPACFNLDPSLAARDGNIQSVELRYTNNKQCVLVDSFTKAWMNSPYIRVSDHVVRGVDDVPGFNVALDEDPAFPERVKGSFNAAYCRRFGRNLTQNACQQPWYEVLVSFVLGESIMTTFKLAANQVFDDLRNFDYHKPSALLPDAPQPEGLSMLEQWYLVRDTTVNEAMEQGFLNNQFPFMLLEKLHYTANEGFYHQRYTVGEDTPRRSRGLMEDLLERRLMVLNKFNSSRRISTNTQINVMNSNLQKYKKNDTYSLASGRQSSGEASLEMIIIQFLEDHSLIMGILTELGFNVLESTLTSMLQQINKVLIPSLKRMLLLQSRRMTVALLGETYKSAMVHALNRAFIKTVTTAAKATVRAVKAAASIANLALAFVTIADFVLMIWDPFGYSNMFPRHYLDDLSSAFLASYYESLDANSRDIIEFVPMHFSNMVMDEEEDYFTDSMLHLADYLAVLDVNSNGQMVNLMNGETIDDFNEEELTGASLAANDTWAYFKWFCARHDALILKPNLINNLLVTISVTTTIGALLYYTKNYKVISVQYRLNLELLFLIITIMCCLVIVLPSMNYYARLAHHTLPSLPIL